MHYPYYELGELCNNIISNPGLTQELKNAALAVKESLGEVVLYTWADKDKGNYEGEGHETKRGLSIVFPRGNEEYNGHSQYKVCHLT